MSISPANRKKIQLLPEHLIDQIKAGEVVEKPASLIKELLENSLDAGSTRIDMHIIANGMELIQIDDNGMGMSFEDLPLAFGRHATSKIQRYDDLFNLHSFGFRGEALASISSVARVSCSSIPMEKDLMGGKINIHGGKVVSHSNYSHHNHGTSIYIKDLFYNTPVRLKFLKSQTSEKNAINRIIHAFIISNPQIEFSVKFDDKEKVIYPAVSKEDFPSRIKKLFFKKKDADTEIIAFQSEYDGHKIRGFLSVFCSASHTGKKHYLFANNRLFQDKSLHQNILRQAEKLWGQGQVGHYVILLDIPPSKIDVNIHPNKIQVKFQESSLIYSLLSSSLKQRLGEYTQKQQASQTGMTLNPPESAIHNTPSANSERMADALHLNEDYRPNNFFQTAPSDQTNTQSSELADNKKFTPITNRYSLIKNTGENAVTLIDTQKLFIYYWIEHLQKAEPLENILSPLLITEPFHYSPGTFDTLFEYFKNIGLEFERLDEQLIVLRTIPDYLNATPYLNFLRVLIEKINKQTTLTTSQSLGWIIQQLEQLTHTDMTFEVLRDAQIQKLLDLFTKQFLIDKNILKTLDSSMLARIMNF